MNFQPLITSASFLKSKLSIPDNLKIYSSGEPPLRLALFSSDQMEQHGKMLAGDHVLRSGRTSNQQLLTRLAKNESILLDVRNLVSDAVKEGRRITPAGEWLLDNFYLIEEQIHTGKMHLPKGYSRELPCLSSGHSAGFPRVYDIAMELISHGDGQVDPENLMRFIQSYQSVCYLKLGELWAIPIMLRLTLIENLRRVAVRIAADMMEQKRACSWADQMIEIAEKDPKSLVIVIADMARSDLPMTSAFVAELSRRLQGHSSALALPLTWLEQVLSETGLTIKKLVQSEIQQQAADQVSMRNSISSLRFFSAMDWHEFVENLSVVEQTLNQDPSSIYGLMDFGTRDRYRHVIENISQNSDPHISEEQVARQALELAQNESAITGKQNRMSHVGYYLIDKGLSQLEQKTKKCSATKQKFNQFNKKILTLLYPASIIGSTTFLTLCSLIMNESLGGWQRIVFTIFIVLGASHLAIALSNWIVTLTIPPDLLPRMDYSKGLPSDKRTLVVVPSMITSFKNIDELTEALEVRFLANQDEYLHFGLLSDFKDSKTEYLPEDEQLQNYAQGKIELLNTKYRKDAFYLFHRPRLWNSSEQLWMGYERKRGKLADLNSVLRSPSEKHFSKIIGDKSKLSSIQYVITLDTDTQLPRDSARQFIGTMAHPLNHAEFDTKKGRVVEGYGIIQPQVSVILPSTNRSRYARLCGSEPGIDPYTRVISNVYQDLFHEGSFIGKGIYEVDTFEQAIKGAFPQNLILSHDLLEGCYARAGLLTDVQLFDEYPSSYSADVHRRKRWIRGDWQILPWILPFVPSANGHLQRNPISFVSRWKIFDNLLRSTTSISLMTLLLWGCTLQSTAWFWIFSVLLIIVLPSLLSTIMHVFQKSDDVKIDQHLAIVLRLAGIKLAQVTFNVACMPYEAYYSLKSIVVTLWRMTISHRHLLEWDQSKNHQLPKQQNVLDFYREMWISPVISLIAYVYIDSLISSVMAIFCPILMLWLLSPAIAWWISLPIGRRKARLSEDQTQFLHKLARKTWAFFENFVGSEDNWLPPDNFQEQPATAVAHRTSPTNIGLSLLANVTAYDFGYIHANLLIERTANTFYTLDKLQRYQGHFYNWYDTTTLSPLTPLYVSTVDSGNLAGHLLTLKPALLELSDKLILSPNVFSGIHDTFRVVLDYLADTDLPITKVFQNEIEICINYFPDSLTHAFANLEQLQKMAYALWHDLKEKPIQEAIVWANLLVQQCDEVLKELLWLIPWSRDSAQTWISIQLNINTNITLRELAKLSVTISPVIVALRTENLSTEDLQYLNQISVQIKNASARAQLRLELIEHLARKSSEFSVMDYAFLYNETRYLLAIGYNVSDRRRDASYYDLLASEARLCSFVAIAQGQIPQQNWFSLGRQLTVISADPALLSWSGSMFEYLMPLLVMPTYDNTLLDQTYKAVVKQQIAYGKLRSVPWGISESGYHALGIHLDYQYRAFGVPGLGLKRGLSDDLVIAPYASMLALMVAPQEACENLERLAKLGYEGIYGLYESIDYTSSRLSKDQTDSVVMSYMAHHMGMSFLSLSYVLLDRPMQKRFESEPLFKSAMLLLQERIPEATAVYSHTTELPEIQINPISPVRVINKVDTVVPEVQLLSNGRYHVMVTHAGGGYSRWKDLAVTRWREDATCDHWGLFCYIRDVERGYYWSTAFQPTLKQPTHYEVIFSEGRAEFRRQDDEIDTHTSIVVSPEDDIELRRTRLTNLSRKRRIIEITSYCEVVLTSPAADALHPAFSNLFVQTEILPEKHAILCSRRSRSNLEKVPWMLHVLSTHDANVLEVSYETDRSKFLGRGHTSTNPIALTSTTKLQETQGSVLDPIVAIRYKILLEPEESILIDIVNGIGTTREDALRLADKYQDRRLADRVFDLAWTHSQVVLRQLNATEADAQLYGHLAGFIIYAHSYLRANQNILVSNQRGQSGLWGYSISGDLPIVLLQIENAANINLVRQLVGAHAYWRLKGLFVDLVIWNEDRAGYRQILHEQILGLIAAGIESNTANQIGGIFVRNADQISSEDQILIQTVARAIVSDKRGLLVDQIHHRSVVRLPPPQLIPTRNTRPLQIMTVHQPRNDLLFFNGYGGFTQDGREYIITTGQGHVTPSPWANVLANQYFGTVVSESSLGYTWSENAHEFRLTPWHNDAVSEQSGEAFYMRDEETGQFWSPIALPCDGGSSYTTRHGFGYTVFEHLENGVRTEVWVYVAIDASVKFITVKIRNLSSRPRHLSVTGYIEWVLGDLRHKTSMHIITEVDTLTGALYGRNPFNTDFGGRTAFFDVDDELHSYSSDRTDFIGRNGSLSHPAAMSRTKLSGKVGAALDPCAAIQVPIQLAENEEREINFRLGSGRDRDDANTLVNRFRGAAATRSALESVWQYWKHTLGSLQIETPDASLNVLANGWLLYQTLACRMWARSGFYQSGGAYGFRDQLQDAMAIIYATPYLTREHILTCASHQFMEGDVQHWWHPPQNRGVRTHCSDDYLWLPLATARYVSITGDLSILSESATFLKGRPVNVDEDSYFDLPIQSDKSASLYEHCVLAIHRAEHYGSHGLPLMGSGDWNDGMNLVGEKGLGESVWLGFFFYDVLKKFSEVAKLHGDYVFYEHCQSEASKLHACIEENSWDGDWYRRAYFDDGSPLGSSINEECKIDSITQSWSVLSSVGNQERMKKSMDAVNRYLVRRDSQLIQLLDPPFNTSNLNPGYIKGYVPGVRENGGQYTHAAIWAAMAFAKLGDNTKAWELAHMINPVNHGNNPDKIATYKVEPYVMAADVYAQSPHTGRGGWTWYTGSAGWMYRLILESLLGFTVEADKLMIKPCMHPSWESYTIHYRYIETMYHLHIVRNLEKPEKLQLSLDDELLQTDHIQLLNDHVEHHIVAKVSL